MGDAQQQSGDLPALTQRVLGQWRRRLRRLADDERPRSGDRGESERILVQALLRATIARMSSGDEILPALAAAAARYGTVQHRERIDPTGLCDELGALRAVTWEILKEDDPRTHEEALRRIFLFDRALSVVFRAAVTAGYDPQEVHRSAGCGEVAKGQGSAASRIEPPPPTDASPGSEG